jgi:hypothetical protein
MNENSNVFPLRQPGNIDDPLTDILRSGARRLLAQAIELEAETFLETMNDLKLADGRDRLVRHGHGPERAIQTGGLDASQSARVDAVNVLASPFVPPARATIIDWFNRARLPAIYKADFSVTDPASNSPRGLPPASSPESCGVPDQKTFQSSSPTGSIWS